MGAGLHTPGHRRPDGTEIHKPGERWWCNTPNGLAGYLVAHDVTEHDHGPPVDPGRDRQRLVARFPRVRHLAGGLMAPPVGHEGDIRGARLSPDRKIARIRKRSQHRITRWRRQLQDRVRTERRDRKQKIKAIKDARVTGLSEKGAEFIARFEGIRLVAYLDPVGIPTIGVGHTGPDVRLGMSISMAEAMDLLQQDAGIAREAVDQGVDVKLSQEQFDALISFAFNIGNAGFLSSTLLVRINDRATRELIRDGFLMWVYAGGQKLEGLVRRREAEARLFNHGKYERSP